MTQEIERLYTFFIFSDVLLQRQSYSPTTLTFSPSKLLLESTYQCFPLTERISASTEQPSRRVLPLLSLHGEQQNILKKRLQDVLLNAFGHLSGVLQSSWITDAATYTNVCAEFDKHFFFSFFLWGSLIKCTKSKMSSQCWVKVKTQGRRRVSCTSSKWWVCFTDCRVQKVLRCFPNSFSYCQAHITAQPLITQKMMKGEKKKNILPEQHNNTNYLSEWTHTPNVNLNPLQRLDCSVCWLFAEGRGKKKKTTTFFNKFWWEAAVDS